MKTFIITGEREGGKTLFIRDLYQYLESKKIPAHGFISKGIFTGDGCKDFEIHALHTGKNIHLASRKETGGYKKYGRFYFNPSAIRFGELILQEAVRKRIRVILIDEIGPIELNDGVWSNMLQNIISRHKKILVITVRKKLIHEVIEKFQINNYRIKDINTSTVKETAEEIFEFLSF